ncbi:MAG: hypothetical protein K0Q59_4565 [Paenibacillus sp.]|jgi:hypothetical protein|nr:hypothetical protein [Paenibacillus sp.]
MVSYGYERCKMWIWLILTLLFASGGICLMDNAAASKADWTCCSFFRLFLFILDTGEKGLNMR